MPHKKSWPFVNRKSELNLLLFYDQENQNDQK